MAPSRKPDGEAFAQSAARIVLSAPTPATAMPTDAIPHCAVRSRTVVSLAIADESDA
jgi:hypothetical protein